MYEVPLKHLVFITLLLVAVGFFVTDLFGMFYQTALASLLLLIVLCVPFLSRNLKWYEPVCAMNAMFGLLAFSGIYLAFSGFTTAEHALHESPVLALRAPWTLSYVAIWILCFYIGYYLFRNLPLETPQNEALVPALAGKQARLIRLLSLVCFLFALGNLIYNIWLFNPNDPLAYFTTFGVSRYREQVNEGIYTTLGYHLFVVGLIFYRFSFRAWSLKRCIVFSVLLIISLVAVLSRGQIFYTFSIVLFLLSLEYFFAVHRHRYLRWMSRILPFLFFCIVFSYFARLVSVEMFLAQQAGQDLNVPEAFLQKISESGALILGKGNVPNLPAMIVYEDHFGNVEAYLYGESLTAWAAAFFRFFDATYIGYSISDIWYPNNVGGIPPGVVHETMANFGFLGSFFFAFFFGVVSALVFNLVVRKFSFLLVVIYLALFVRFWFILPKVEFAVLSNAIWLFLPICVVYAFYLLFGRFYLWVVVKKA